MKMSRQQEAVSDIFLQSVFGVLGLSGQAGVRHAV